MELFLFFLAGVAIAIGGLWARRRFAGFDAQSAEDYNGARVNFDLRQHLNGPHVAEGVIFGPTGRVTSRFVAEFEGHWDGDSGTLEERFVYGDGVRVEREWRIELLPQGQVRAEADDVEGAATGTLAGSALGLRYRYRLPDSQGGHVLDAVDWMYLLDNGTLANRSQFRKFGIKVAEIIATIRPMTPAESAELYRMRQAPEHEAPAVEIDDAEVDGPREERVA